MKDKCLKMKEKSEVSDVVKVACIVLTFNEENSVKMCLERIKPFVDYLLVLDGGSEDKTYDIVKRYADKVVVKPFSGSFAEERNYARSLVPKNHEWLLWVDADELWDVGFLESMKTLLKANKNAVFRFPRCNLPDGKNYPDYQVRLFRNSRDIEWRRDVHEIPYYVPDDIPLDQLDREDRRAGLPVVTMDDFPIIHLPRDPKKKRSWW